MKENRTIKDEIIEFVQNSPEEVDLLLDAFIAGMQAQKNLAECQREMGNSPARNGRGLSVVKTDAGRE